MNTVKICLCSRHREISAAPGAAKTGRAGEGWVLSGDARVTHTHRPEDKLLFIAAVTWGKGNQPQSRQPLHGAFPNSQECNDSCPQQLCRAQQGRQHLQWDGRGGSRSGAMPHHTVCMSSVLPTPSCTSFPAILC